MQKFQCLLFVLKQSYMLLPPIRVEEIVEFVRKYVNGISQNWKVINEVLQSCFRSTDQIMIKQVKSLRRVCYPNKWEI